MLMGPCISIPLKLMVFPACVAWTFPPVSAARSTMMLPCFIWFSISFVTSIGAFRPGIAAVVITTSARAMCFVRNVLCAWFSSSVCARAYPPLVSASWFISCDMKVAPRLSTCSAAAALTSKAWTIAPSLFAVAIACSPATPAPSISTCAGGIVPAAVIIMGKNFPMELAAMSAALYPANDA